MTDQIRKPDADEIRHAYRLFLGREAESDQVVDQLIEAADDNWLGGFIRSEEFRNGTARAILDGTVLQHHAVSPFPSGPLLAWVTTALPLTPDARARAGEAVTWAGLLLTVFEDDAFGRSVVDRAQPNAVTIEFVQALRAYVQASAVAIACSVERVSGDEIRGWVVDAADPGRELAVELRIDGRFIAAAKADAIRRDVQERFDSQGRHGFALQYRQNDRMSGKSGVLVEQVSGLTLAQVVIPARQEPPLDLLSSLRAELGEVRRVISRIERSLPEYQGHFSYGLFSYAEYFDAYYRDQVAQPLPAAPVVDLAVILTSAGATPVEMSRALASIAEQRCRPCDVTILYADREHRQEEESSIARAIGTMPVGTRVQARPCDAKDWSAALNMAVHEAEAANILILPAQGLLAPDAVGLFFGTLQGGACAVYADEDRVELTADGVQGRHRDPVLRTSFDHDLLRQVDCIGDVVALRRDVTLRLGFAAHPGTAALFDLLLRIEPEFRADIVHLPRILFSRTRKRADVPVLDRLGAVREQLAREGDRAEVVLHEDPIGAQIPGQLRLRYPIPQGTRAAIIIPTRDRLDLLGPCLASISNAAASNRTALEVIVVDNGSQLSTTRAVLDTLEQAGGLRVLQLDGPFNWALMNNRAAALTDAEVLIFLNNDTVGIGRTCWDELVMQALRPEVGAVGARLLYEDGTIQHAGVVVGGGHGFVDHEGVGDAGTFPGYLGRHSSLRRVSAVTGACLATRADRFRSVGGFDETLPVEGNDVDYCLRLRAAGLAILYNPYATLYHFESKSRGYNQTDEKRRDAALVTERLRERWEDRFGHDPYYNAHFDRLTPAMTKLRPPVPLSIQP